MSHGLRVFSATGSILLDTNDGIARLVGEYLVSGLSSGSSVFISVPGMGSDGNWMVFQVSHTNGLFATISAGGFTVTCGYLDVTETTWTVLRKDGAASAGHGFMAINDSGDVQIDQDFTNYVKLDSGTGRASGTLLPSVAGASIYAVRPTAAGVGINMTASKGVEVTSGTYDWIAYGRQDSAILPSTGFGLRVYRADGSVAYDSDARLLRPINSLLFPSDSYSHTASLDAGPYGMRPYVSHFNLAPISSQDLGFSLGVMIGPRVTFNSDTSITTLATALWNGPPISSGPWVANYPLQFFTDY